MVYTIPTLLLAVTSVSDMIYVVISSVALSSKVGLAAALGLVFSFFEYTVFIIGLTTLLAASTVAFTIFKLMCAVHLIFWAVACGGLQVRLNYLLGVILSG